MRRNPFPTPQLELSVRPAPLKSRATSMLEVIDELLALRDEENPPEHLAYFGAVSFGASLEEYCRTGCVLGASVVGDGAGSSPVIGGAAVGVGYSGPQAAITFAHELGHVYGLQHAPCKTRVDLDPAYPHPNGKLGDWGFDTEARRLVDPDPRFDFMSYCDPNWISGYHYGKLQRFLGASPSPLAQSRTADTELYRTILMEPGRAPRWGKLRTVWGAPRGVKQAAEFGFSKRKSQSVDVHRVPLAEGGSTLLYVRQKDAQGACWFEWNQRRLHFTNCG